jgi:2-polyprenyl-6-methoxyphenol hydroxylase-like FAD-dependent oxidoreductase
MREDKTVFLFAFRDEYLTGKSPSNEQERRAALASVFADVGWECPQILAAMAEVGDVYFDRVSQIRMDCWTKGRTALIGDAAACVSLMAGEGAGLAMAEAYVLAGEIRNCGGDHAAAFARYLHPEVWLSVAQGASPNHLRNVQRLPILLLCR